jgi:cell fate (sporulation/competence/biofilm development) regulator YlbF (YheA/YmcA/DUF963 family)
MSWRLQTAKPRLGAKITVTTLLKEFEQIRRTLRLALDKTWTQMDTEKMKRVQEYSTDIL